MTSYHCHTQFCDGASTAEEILLAAIEAKFPAIGFSSHAPVPFPTCWTMPKDKMGSYILEMLNLMDKYGDRIEIYRGFEVDYIKDEISAKSKHIVDFYPDFLISSIHFMDKLVIDGERWTIDNTSAEFKQGLDEIYGGDIKKLVRDFTQQSADMMELGGFDIVGHIDKVYQYGKEYLSLDDKWYRNEILSLLELAKAKKYIVEINTKYYETMGFFFPHQDFMKDIKEMKIPVQVNSDCHASNMITTGYDAAYQALKAAGVVKERVMLDGEWIDIKIK